MHSTQTLVTALFASVAFATPVPQSTSSNSTSQIQKPSGSQCATQSNGSDPTNYWGVYEINSVMSSAQGTGDYAGGFLDNLRGQCGGSIENWQAVPDGHGGVACTFNAPKSCMGDQVAAALHAAVEGAEDWIMCQGDTFNGLLNYDQKISEETMNYMSSILGVVGSFLPALAMK